MKLIKNVSDKLVVIRHQVVGADGVSVPVDTHLASGEGIEVADDKADEILEANKPAALEIVDVEETPADRGAVDEGQDTPADPEKPKSKSELRREAAQAKAEAKAKAKADKVAAKQAKADAIAAKKAARAAKNKK